MKKIILLTGMITFLGMKSQAQNRIQLAYSGSMFVQPGINLDYSKGLFTKIRNWREEKIVSQQVFGGLQVGGYYHQNMHTGLYLTPHLEWVKTTRNGFQYGIDLPLGYLRTFIPQVYQVASSGEVQKKNLSGTGHFIVAPSFRLGKKRSGDGWVDEWYVKNKLMYITPYPQGSTYRYFLEIGITHLLN